MTEEHPGRRADRSGAGAPGRRGVVQRHRLDAVVVLAMLLPTLVVVSLFAAGADDPEPWVGQGPSPARLSHATVVCPAPVPAGTESEVLATRVAGVDGGEVAVRVGDGDGDALDRSDPVTAEGEELAAVRSGAGAVVLTGEGDAAPGLVAGRGAGTAAAPECRPPSFDEWYVGLGASAQESSAFELVNPDPGPAVVDITLHGPNGAIDEPALRGIRVPGNGVRVLELSEIAPRRVRLAGHLSVTRGRVSAAVRHAYDPLGTAQPQVDYLPAQPEPSTENLLLGVPAEGIGRSLYLANPGDDETRATVRVVTGDSVFTPAGVEDVVLPPQSLRKVSLDDVLTGSAAEGALGLQVESGAPVVAGVETIDGDLGRIGPVEPTDDSTVTVVPAGAKRLLLGAAIRAGTVRVTATAADGEVLVDEERIEVSSDRAVAFELPDDAVMLSVEARNTPIAGTVALSGTTRDPASAQVRLRAAEVYAQVPEVVPE
ncbi:MAG TPA: DUF5719 family protein [Nocardioides sp.]|nr:DUF5719 family protein [Nocardioides sp.]